MYEQSGNDILAKQPHSTRAIFFAVVALLLVAAYFNLDIIYNSARWNYVVRAWPFLGEEGVFLGWTQRILNGEVRGKDYFSVYGPLMVFPLVLMQKIAGEFVSVGRWYAFILNLTAYILLAFIINRVIRSSLVAVLALFFMVIVYPWTIYSANMSPLRVILGILPLVSLLRFRATGKGMWVVSAGALCGASLLFSQEVGASALFASLAMIFFSYFEEKNFPALARRTILLVSGCVVPIIPFMVYFMIKGALPEIVDSLLVYPRLALLGYAGLVFPSLADAVKSFTSPLVFDNYWIITVYIFAAIPLLIRFFSRRTDTKTAAITFLLFFGVVLYRAALGRSSSERALFVAPPAFLLLFMAFDHSVYQFRQRPRKYQMLMVLVTGVIIAVVAAMSSTRIIINDFGRLFVEKNRFDGNENIPVAGLERDDVYHHPDTARDIRLIAGFFRTHPTPGGYVYFFPQEPAYYFIFDKRNPTRYPTAFLAATHDMRRELVADLEEKKPLYVVYSISTWRIDGIPEQVYAPEIFDYIVSAYDVVEDHGSIMFLRRKKGST